MHKFIKYLPILLMSTCIAGCGGGGGSTPPAKKPGVVKVTNLGVTSAPSH